MAVDPDDEVVRVRGGFRGFRMVRLGDWKQEQREKKGKLLKTQSRRQRRAETKHKDKRKKLK